MNIRQKRAHHLSMRVQGFILALRKVLWNMDKNNKALGNYVSNLAHTYFLNVFTKTVHTWTKVIVNNHCHCFKCIFLYCMTSKIGLMWLSAKLYRIPTISLLHFPQLRGPLRIECHRIDDTSDQQTEFHE